MDCFEDIIKTNHNFDKTLQTTISRFTKTSDSTILISESPNFAANYSTKNGLIPMRSWVFSHLNGLSSPLFVVRESTKNQFIYAIQEPNLLTKWCFDNQNRMAKHLFTTKIIGSITLGLNTIIVFINGFCQSISNAIKTKDEEKVGVINKNEFIHFIDGFLNKTKDNLIIYLITKNNKSKDNIIESIYKLTLCIETDLIIKTECQKVVNRLTNWSLCPKTGTILSVVSSAQNLVIFTLNGKTENQLMTLNESSLDVIYGISITNSGTICIIGKTKDKNFSIELWEMKFGSLLGKMTLPYEPLNNDSKVIDDMVLIACSKGLVLVRFKTQSISLSQIVGKNKKKESVLDSELNRELNQICVDLNSDKPIDEISETFTDIIRQISSNLPEDIILKLLLITSQKLRESETKSSSLKSFFQKLVSLPFNELFMISKLKSMDLKFPQILSLLQSLVQMFPTNNSAIIDWISIIIDSYLNLFIMNPNQEFIELIQQILLKINNFSQFCEELEKVKTLFDIILTNKSNPLKEIEGNVSKVKGQYSIELLRF